MNDFDKRAEEQRKFSIVNRAYPARFRAYPARFKLINYKTGEVIAEQPFVADLDTGKYKIATGKDEVF